VKAKKKKMQRISVSRRRNGVSMKRKIGEMARSINGVISEIKRQRKRGEMWRINIKWRNIEKPSAAKIERNISA